MDKKSSQQYLKLKHEISKYIFQLDACKKIINDFNSYVSDLANECSDNKYNKTAIKYYQSKIDELEGKLSVSKNIDPSIKIKIDALKEELKNIEQQFGDIIREKSIKGVTYPIDSPFNNEEIQQAENRMMEIKRELKKYREYETDTLESSLDSMRNIQNNYISLVKLFNSHKSSYISNLNVKYINTLSSFEILNSLKNDYEQLTNRLNDLLKSNSKLKIIEIPTPECETIKQDVLNSIIDYLDASHILKYKSSNHNGTVSHLINNMVVNHYTSRVMPTIKSEVNETLNILSVNFIGQVSFQCSPNKIIKIYGNPCSDSNDAIVKVVKDFDNNGYAILKLKKNNSDVYKFIAVDIVGNIYYIEDDNSYVDIVPQVLEIINVLYNKKSIDMINKSYFKDKSFVECLNYFLERKYLYEKGFLDEDKKYLSREDKRAIPALKFSDKNSERKLFRKQTHQNLF